jgi:purine-binding chemotaxis protein CheW
VEAQPSTRQYVTFKLGEEVYALDVANAREVAELTSLTPMPKAPNWVRGVLNLRGTVVPVVDLKRKFDMGETKLERGSSVLIVEFSLEVERYVIGVLCDVALEVFEYADKDIEAPPKFGARYSRSYLRGMGRREQYLFAILVAEKVFADTDTLLLAEDDEAGRDGVDKEWETEHASV